MIVTLKPIDYKPTAFSIVAENVKWMRATNSYIKFEMDAEFKIGDLVTINNLTYRVTNLEGEE